MAGFRLSNGEQYSARILSDTPRREHISAILPVFRPIDAGKDGNRGEQDKTHRDQNQFASTKKKRAHDDTRGIVRDRIIIARGSLLLKQIRPSAGP